MKAFKQAVMDAYSDCNDNKAERNLKFISVKVPIKEAAAAALAAIPDGYNGFSAERAFGALADIFGETATVCMAREGSVCIYILPSHNLWLSRAISFEALNADEVCFCPEKGMFRIWWD